MMKYTPLSIVRFLQKSQYLFLVIIVALACLHLYQVSTVSFRLDKELVRNTGSEFLSISTLFWGAALSLIWQKRQTLKLESGVFSSFLGIALIALAVFGSIFLPPKNNDFLQNDDFLHISPFISAIGVALMASGVKGLKQYWRELLLFFVLIIPVEELLPHMANLDVLTARFANFLLVHFGFDASSHGAVVALPTGAVEVDPGCSGLRAITRLLQLSALILVMLPTKPSAKIIVPIVAILIAFTINSIRVAILALLIANSHRKAFDFWHDGTGSHGISLVSVLALWLLCQLLVKQDEPEQEQQGQG